MDKWQLRVRCLDMSKHGNFQRQYGDRAGLTVQQKNTIRTFVEATLNPHKCRQSPPF